MPRSCLVPLLASCLLLAACVDDDDAAGPDAGPLPDEVAAVLDLPSVPLDYDEPLPAHFQSDFVAAMDNTPADNPISDDGATLGRVLFYDPTLSASDTVACADCHPQAMAFSDPARFSTGFAGGLTGRNAMGVADARFYRSGAFFWDERAATLEVQVLLPIQNQVEMGLTLDQLVARVAAQPYYPYLFEQAFGDAEVTSDRIARALAQFARSIVSYRSRFDDGMVATGDIAAPFPGYSTDENLGKALFLGRAGCATCHLDAGPPRPGPRANQAAFFIDRATNNGLDASTDVDDNGKGEITGLASDDGRFKSPSLRNAAVTAPYMHDGRFTTLDQVVRHYNDGVLAHPNLDPRLRAPDGAPRRLGLSDAEIAALVAFLDTLTDQAMLDDIRFADPFRVD